VILLFATTGSSVPEHPQRSRRRRRSAVGRRCGTVNTSHLGSHGRREGARGDEFTPEGEMFVCLLIATFVAIIEQLENERTMNRTFMIGRFR
jgi:hypothetical protein